MMKIQEVKPYRLLKDLEQYLLYHVDMVWGIGSVGMGWSLVLGPDFNHLIKTPSPVLDMTLTLSLGVSLVIAGCILMVISVTDTPWRDNFKFFLGPGFLISLLMIFHEFQMRNYRPNAFVFFILASMLVTYLLMRRTGIRP